MNYPCCCPGQAARGTLITHAWQVGRHCFWALFKTFTSTHTHTHTHRRGKNVSRIVGTSQSICHALHEICLHERPQLLNPHWATELPENTCPHTHAPLYICNIYTYVYVLKQSWSTKRAAPECELMVASITPARPQTTTHRHIHTATIMHSAATSSVSGHAPSTTRPVLTPIPNQPDPTLCSSGSAYAVVVTVSWLRVAI